MEAGCTDKGNDVLSLRSPTSISFGLYTSILYGLHFLFRFLVIRFAYYIARKLLRFSRNLFRKLRFFRRNSGKDVSIFGTNPILSEKITTTYFNYFSLAQLMLCGKLDHKKLEIYELAHQFVLHVYSICSSFPQDESNNLSSQIKRAAVSLPLNIAEATGCMSFRTCLNFLSFSYRSCREIDAALRLCKDLNYIALAQYQDTFERLDKFTRKLYKYMEYISSQADKRSGYRQQNSMMTEFVKKNAGMDLQQ